MSAEDHALTLRNLIEGIDENRTLLLERLEHKAVVYYLMAHVERASVGAQRTTDRFDRTIDARTKTTWLRQDYFLNRHFAQGHPLSCNWLLSARSILAFQRRGVRGLAADPYFAAFEVFFFPDWHHFF